MIDPLTALCLAGTVIEALRLNDSISSHVRELRLSRNPEYVSDLKKQVSDARKAVTRITSLTTGDASDDGINEEKQVGARM